MSEIIEKEVDFATWCPKCRDYAKSEADDDAGCWDCLDQPYNYNSRKPVKFKEAD